VHTSRAPYLRLRPCACQAYLREYPNPNPNPKPKPKQAYLREYPNPNPKPKPKPKQAYLREYPNPSPNPNPEQAYLREYAFPSCDPFEELLLGPAYATTAVLKASGLKLSDMDVIEFHEAFAGQARPLRRTLALTSYLTHASSGRHAPHARVAAHERMWLQPLPRRAGLSATCD